MKKKSIFVSVVMSLILLVSVNLFAASPVLLKNFGIQYFGYDPGQIREFYLYVNKTKDPRNDSTLQFEMMDMIQAYQYNVDMIVKYSGATCTADKLITESDYQFCKSKWLAGGNCKGENGLYSRLSKNAFESAGISNNPLGCYYIRIKNVATKREDKISIKWSDSDSS